MTFNPAKFASFNHRIDIILTKFKEFSPLFNWMKKTNPSIADIGPGPGHVLMKLKEMFPGNYKEIIGLDLSKDMVDYLNSLPDKDPRISSRIFDCQSPEVTGDLKNRFDFIFSSFCLTYIKDYRRVILNSSQLLKNDGELFYIWSKYAFINDFYKELSRNPKWSPYISDDSKNWKNYAMEDGFIDKMEKYIKEAGMKITKLEDFDYNCESESAQSFIENVQAYDMVSPKIPKADLPEYMKEFAKLVSDYVVVDENAENGMKAKFPLPIMVLAARKI